MTIVGNWYLKLPGIRIVAVCTAPSKVISVRRGFLVNIPVAQSTEVNKLHIVNSYQLAL